MSHILTIFPLTVKLGCKKVRINVMKLPYDIQTQLARLDQVLQGAKKLLIVTHNTPDPDALASGLALKYLAEKRHNLQAHIAYGGEINRAENLAMVRELRIPLRRINRIRYTNYDRVAIVDTQPSTDNHSLPTNIPCDIIIDHHPELPDTEAPFKIVDPEIGTAATILIQLLYAAELSIPTDLATALTYAIRSETQELGRETSDQDIAAYFLVYAQASMGKLARISLPKLPRSYFVTLSKTMQQTRVFRHLICTHLGDVPTPETVGEMADLLLRHQRISWTLCTGRFRKHLILSMRSSNPDAKAGQIMRQLVKEPGSAGGHDMFAGGRIPLHGFLDADISILEIRLSQQFAELLGYENAEWKPLLESAE